MGKRPGHDTPPPPTVHMKELLAFLMRPMFRCSTQHQQCPTSMKHLSYTRLRTQKAQLYLGWSLGHPHFSQCPRSDCRLRVYIVSNHRGTSLTFGDDGCDRGIRAVPMVIKSPMGEKKKKKSFLLQPCCGLHFWRTYFELSSQRHLRTLP